MVSYIANVTKETIRVFNDDNIFKLFFTIFQRLTKNKKTYSKLKSLSLFPGIVIYICFIHYVFLVKRVRI